MENKNLKLPANCAVLNEEEMTYTQGGGIVAQVLYAFGRMFKNTKVNSWDEELQRRSEANGGVVSHDGNVYTFSNGTTYTAGHGNSISWVVGDFFYGLGDLFNAFGL